MLEIRDISKVVKEIRRILNMSQEELAARLGVSFATVNRWENERIKPRGKARKAIFALIEEIGLEENDLESSEDSAGLVKKRQRKISKNDVLGTKSMEQMLWSAACSIRGERMLQNLRIISCRLYLLKGFQMYLRMKSNGFLKHTATGRQRFQLLMLIIPL